MTAGYTRGKAIHAGELPNTQRDTYINKELIKPFRNKASEETENSNDITRSKEKSMCVCKCRKPHKQTRVDEIQICERVYVYRTQEPIGAGRHLKVK